MHDESVLRELLQEAGFSPVVVEKQKKDSQCRSAEDATEALIQAGAISSEIMSLKPALISEIKSLLAKELGKRYGKVPMVAPMSAVIAQAWK